MKRGPLLGMLSGGRSVLVLLCLTVSASARAADTALAVDATRGKNTMTAVFDAALGERITASSSAVGCSVQFDPKGNTFSGSCKLALDAIIVDNDDTKTDHFRQWVTNKKSDPKKCVIEAKFSGVRAGPLEPEKPAEFSATVPFTVCGRGRVDGGAELVKGTILKLPAGTYGQRTNYRVRAKIDNFDREKYGIGPQFTEGWLARVQSLAKVVAPVGAIELGLFASE